MTVGGILNLGPSLSYMGCTLAFLFPCDLSEEQAQILPSGIIHRSNLGWTLLAIIHYFFVIPKKKQPFSIINLHTYTYPYTYTPYEMNKTKTEASSVVLLQHPALLQVLLDHQVRNRSQHKPHRLRVRSTRPVNVHRLVVPIQTK